MNSKKKIIKIILIPILLIVVLNIFAYAISFSLTIEGENSLKVNEKTQLKAIFKIGSGMGIFNPDTGEMESPGPPTKTDITNSATWKSSNPSIATVDSNGVVTGKSEGTVTIMAEGVHPENENFLRDSKHEIVIQGIASSNATSNLPKTRFFTDATFIIIIINVLAFMFLYFI